MQPIAAGLDRDFTRMPCPCALRFSYRSHGRAADRQGRSSESGLGLRTPNAAGPLTGCSKSRRHSHLVTSCPDSRPTRRNSEVERFPSRRQHNRDRNIPKKSPRSCAIRDLKEVIDTVQQRSRKGMRLVRVRGKDMTWLYVHA